MNSILNEITYCEGRITNNSSSILEDSPARLKLRPNTFNGICASNDARRKPAFNIAEFAIPTANMASGVYTSDETGSTGGMVSSNNSEFRITETMDGVSNAVSDSIAPRKVRLSPEQFKKVSSVIEPVKEAENQLEDSYAPVVNTAVEVQEEVRVPEVVESVQTAPVSEVEQPEMPVVTAVEEVAMDDVNDTASTEVEENNVVNDEAVQEPEEVKEVDDFTKLQRVTEEYQMISEEYSAAKAGLTSAEEELSSSKEKLEELERAIIEKNEELTSQRNVIDTAKKDIVEINEEIKRVNEEIKKKISLIEKAREKKAQETRKVREEIRQKAETNERYQYNIETNSKELEKMQEEAASLTDEENKILSEKSKARSELEKVEEILRAISLPEEAFENEESEVTISEDAQIVADEFKLSEDTSFPSVEEEIEFEVPKVYKKAA